MNKLIGQGEHMTKKMTMQETMACNNCLIAMTMLDLSLNGIRGANGAKSMIRELAPEFCGSHYNSENITDRWDDIKEMLMNLDIPDDHQSNLAGMAAEESIQTLLLVHAAG
jgi:hypothetical protein